MLKRLLEQKALMIGVGVFATAMLTAVFLYLQKYNVATMNGQPRIVYRVQNFDAQGESVRDDYRSVSIDGTDDILIHSTTEQWETLTVFNHSDIGIGTSTASRFFDKKGKDISDTYKDLDIDITPYEMSPAYTADGGLIGIAGRTREGAHEVSVLNTKTGQIKKYPCAECKNYTEAYAVGFSGDTNRLYFNVVRDRANHPLDSDSDLKYLYVELESGNIVDMHLPYFSNEYYKLYPRYDLAFKIISARHDKAGSVDLISLTDMSQKRLADDLGVGTMAFNGKDVVYDVFVDRSVLAYYPPKQEIKGVNINSGERYHILPSNLVNTAKRGQKEVRDFLPNSATFIYTIEYDSGWEVRMHTIDTGEDRSVVNLSAGRFADKTSYIKQYIGVIF
ncbi:MAG: hypothetical protein UY31_C0049G0004 [Candidatus Wolfebacteria bacterium GW2011_GWE1_48_7]|uniref:Uncharacterized protein n=2 Tax=Candidatus Wolfeibacteriota TaxID=1752735 RepID=A0A0G1U6D0_9BACT|nr:MAG: hypothetical protein UX70_C0001G0787 [Candidatus Wolfebacteria bacterium GW2011_GWB1_47_1]KKU34715.1 MAG: hypothetical protein UX49_C0037G0009 [Candidatus Wolfebacteria bacterium GW2011_GWC2_46_275]KKU53705.1 MAG: hypothetical protein UX76_C0011G0050 [Candidatus Wolfebacteria bacterium GW2011_GWC1_47_103]KKU70782.1 MAG: hypothetical protein UX96_C0037G0003 [Candidatus Wolfebacteria bacterium GW2011_GWB1_47_243]KKU75890.1 MAG: hypothetical protein UY00_C0031G0003 [Candidatus Wolfebacteri